MSLEIKETEFCKYQINYSSTPEKVQEKRDEVLAQLKSAQVPGFRNGKAPKDIIKHHFKTHIESELRERMALQAYEDTLAEKEIRPFGSPKFTEVNLKDDEFSCKFDIHTIPEFELKEYKGFEIPKGSYPDPVEMSEKIIEQVRIQNGERVQYGDDDFVQVGDNVIANISILDGDTELQKLEGELFAVGSAKYYPLNDNMLGMKQGEIREFSELMKEGEHEGKTLKFKAELVMGSKTNPHALDEELAKKMGLESLDALIEACKSAAQSRVRVAETRHLYDQIMGRLTDANDFALPDWLMDAEARSLAANQREEWEEMTPERKEEYKIAGGKSIRLSLVLDKIRQNEPDAQLTDEEGAKAIRKKISETYPGSSVDEILSAFAKSGQLKVLLASVKDEYTLDFLVSQSKIIE